MKNIAILAYPDIALFELGCATELFALERPELDRKLDNWYHAEVISFLPGPFKTLAGVEINVRQIDSLSAFDTLIVPSWPTLHATIDSHTSDAILKFHQRGSQILSFCSGAFLLGYLGILDGQQATTHWRYEQRFTESFPNCEYLPNVLYTLTESLGCSAGSAAAIDLGLAVIRQDFNSQVANSVARRLVLSGYRKGGQSQFVETPVERKPSRLSESLDWALQQLHQPLSVDQLAKKTNMSRRNFDRVFRKRMGISPQEWLISQRLVLARQLIETGGISVEQVAEQSGFSSAGNLRHHFRKQLGVSIRQYRDSFCH